MELTIGAFLKELRERRDMPPDELAQQIPVHRSTILRWEQNRAAPRVMELEAALNALQASAEERARAVALLDAPRGERACRSGSDNGMPAVWMPAKGELVKALRLRLRWSQAQLADHLGKDKTYVSRLESSEVLPVRERKELFRLLGPSAEELRLLQEPLLYGSSHEVDLDDLEQELEELTREVRASRHPSPEVAFLALERQLWFRAGKSSRALFLLACAWMQHADYLLWRGRLEEMNRYATRTAQLLREKRICSDGRFLLAISLTARYSGRTHPQYGMDQLKLWEKFAVERTDAISYWRDLGSYAGDAGATRQALKCLERSRRLALPTENEEAVHLAALVRARVHTKRGEHREALKLLYDLPPLAPGFRVIRQITIARALYQVQEHAEAKTCLLEFYRLIEAHNLTHMEKEGAALAAQLLHPDERSTPPDPAG